jgi:hypothetical protein
MQNWNDQYQLTRLHREDLLREAANARLASELARPERPSLVMRRAWQPMLALLALLVGTHR